MENKKKQVILDYVEHEQMLEELQKFKDYAKLLESGDKIIIIQNSRKDYYHYARGYSMDNFIPEVIQGDADIKEFLDSLNTRVEESVNSYWKKEKEYKHHAYKYKELLNKLEKNWIYKLFYSKK